MSVNVKTVLATNIKTRWREPFASEALNKRNLGVIPPGVYRGLGLAASSPPVDLTVTVTADAVTSDHVAIAEMTSGFTVGYTNSGGDFDLDLSDPTLLSTDVVIVLSLVYVVGSDTTGVFIAYPLTEYDALSTAAKSDLVVLGTVTVPAAGVIPAANITSTRRSLPFERRSTGLVPWTPLVRNGSFDAGTDDGLARGILYWHRSIGTPIYDWAFSTTDAVSASRSLAMVVGTSASAFTAIMRHRIGSEVPEVPGGRRIRVSFQKRQLIVPTAGSVEIVALFKPASGAAAETTVITLDVSGVDASFIKIEKTIPIPSGQVMLDSVRIKFVLTNFPSTGEAFLFDDFQVWLEPDPASLQPERSAQGAMVDANVLNIRGENAEKVYTTAHAQLDFDGANLTIINPNTTKIVGVDHDYAVLGTRSIGSIANAEIPRVQAPVSVFAGVEFTLMWESVPSGQAGHRFYVRNDGGTVRTFNAGYDNTANTWSRDDITIDSTGVFEDVQGITAKRQLAAAGTWLELGWDLVRVVTDRTGYRSGRISEVRVNWIDSIDPPGWTSATAGLGSVTYAPDALVFEGLSAKLATTGAGSGSITSDHTFVFPSAKKIWVLETEAYFTNIAGTGGNIGFLKLTGSTSGAYFSYLPSLSGFWRVITFDNANLATPNIVTTAVAPVSNTPQRFRIEMYGSSITGGARVLFYIDNALVGTSTTKQPDNPMDTVVSESDDGAAALRTFVVAPLAVYYNRNLRDDV